MLRPYKPVGDEIFTLHKMIKHLVCNVWCQADNTNYLDKIISGKRKRYKIRFRQIVLKYADLNTEVERIYNKFSGELTLQEKALIKRAFKVNNRIEDLCDGKIKPFRKSDLPKIVEEDIYPLFKYLYKELFKKKLVNGDKLAYYQKLIKSNGFGFCPCCGYMPLDSAQVGSREAYDHYLPISEYPFAGINFKNLVPLCYKCNSGTKHSSDTLKNGRKAFYPFRNREIEIEIKFTFSREFKQTLSKFIKNEEKENLLNAHLTIDLTSPEQEQVDTWNDLFNIKKRFIDRTVGFSFELLEDIREIFIEEAGNKTHLQIIESKLQRYRKNRFSNDKFLKAPFLETVKDWSALIKYWDSKKPRSSHFKQWVSSD